MERKDFVAAWQDEFKTAQRIPRNLAKQFCMIFNVDLFSAINNDNLQQSLEIDPPEFYKANPYIYKDTLCNFLCRGN